ncbi:hypothetical protein RB608_21785 [Nocardioides sp. LHD-245]|uniref:hypothetical protein n=1 Tax=Nocardioides sp. LHD-245 TaxID=3051387 RepID=UPI0027E046A3|nr:hypothetical protein [Nocardioides sp. LHD-245]
MALLSRSGIVTIAVATGLVLTAGTGGAVAGAMITGKQIKNNTVTTKDIKDGSLTGADVADGGLGGADIQDGSVSLADLAGSTRDGLLGPRASGLVHKNVTLDHFRGPAGSTASVSRAGAGIWCVTVAGTSTPVNANTAVMVASPNFADDSTSDGSDVHSVIEVNGGTTAGCPNGFPVYTYSFGAGALTIADQGFTFVIN